MTRGNILTEEEIARLAALPSGSSSPSTTSTSAIP